MTAWSLGVPANPTATPPTPAIASDMERLRDLFNFRSNELPLLRSAMNWLLENNPDGIITVQIYLGKADTNFIALETVYSDEDYALMKADVLEFDVQERSTGAEILRQRYKEKLWSALSLDGYFCREAYLNASTSATSGRS